ncbi:hypothetical protein C0Q70_16757 [Pomacea canaliculata]|uniref:Uncharacterized protein n=1 Tax=Pomacea canaliculata TaxID=400727 RepID=A0A2T7NQN7_POMCA|nr:uncharacterized protein LOC112573536 [Pomacea canaliculata]PVD23485.1 hypothetical protein C0Q70_16757 [Pomacea canaliculata]
MTTYLSAEFVERHITKLSSTLIPEIWDVEHGGQFYQLDLKMCQISALHFDFQWGKQQSANPHRVSFLESQSQVVLIDISLNDLTFLHQDWLAPFSNLRALDASLNQLKHVEGVEALPRLRSLNLSHNLLHNADGLTQSITLVDLRLAANNLQNISSMPPLINLRILDVSNNKLQSLDGLSSLPRLEELYAQRNELLDLLPVMSCGNLRVLNAANNQISNLDTTVKVLTGLRFLQALSLYGNPIEREAHYQADILRGTSIMTLDNIVVKPMAKQEEDHQKHADNLFTLKDAARLAFQERQHVAKERLDDNVMFLHKRIKALQQEYTDFEAKLNADLQSCLRYLDTLSDAELHSTDRSALGAVWGPSHHLHLWSKGSQDTRGHHPRTDYSQIKATDEVLRCAYNELVKQHHGSGGE